VNIRCAILFRLGGFLAVLMTAACLPSIAAAAPVVIHQGSNDPQTEGWTFSGSGGTTTIAGTEIIAAVTHNFWNVNDSSDLYAKAYTYSLTPGNLAGDWVFDAIVRVIDSPIVPPGPDVGGTGLIVADGLNYWSFYLTNSTAGTVSNSSPLGLSHSFMLNTTTDYHHYQIAFSQNGAGTGDDTANFFSDGTLVFGNVPRSDLYVSGASYAYFGPVSSAGTSDANYELVRFDDGTPAAVPGPATLLLVSAGLVWAAASARARRRARR